MATKPGSVYTHSTDANFGSGPAIGNPTKLPVLDADQGFVPGEGIAAEPVNWLFHEISEWLDWVQAGSFIATADAHLVETSVGGRIAVQGATIGDIAGGFNPLLVQNASPSDNTTLVNTGSGVGLRVTSAGIAGVFVAGGSSLGIDVTGGNFAGTGIKATGVGSGVGGTFFGGSLGEAAIFTGELSSLQPVIKLDRSGGGAPTRGAVHAVTQTSPSSPIHGDWWTVAEKFLSNVSAFSFSEGTSKRRAWGTTEGYFYYHDEALSETTNDTVTPLTVITATVDPTPGKYMVFFSCSGYSKDAGDPPLRIHFDTGAAGKSVDYEVPTDIGQNRKFPFCATWQIDITTVTTLSIKVSTGVGGQEVAASDAEITIQGAHDIKTGPP